MDLKTDAPAIYVQLHAALVIPGKYSDAELNAACEVVRTYTINRHLSGFYDEAHWLKLFPHIPHEQTLFRNAIVPEIMRVAPKASPNLAESVTHASMLCNLLMGALVLISGSANAENPIPSLPWILGLEFYREGEDRLLDAFVIARAPSYDILTALVTSGDAKKLIGIYATTTSHREKYATILRTQQAWFHLTHDKTLAEQPKEVFETPDLEANLSQDLGGLSDGQDLDLERNIGERFYNLDGAEKQGLPELWMLESGCW